MALPSFTSKLRNAVLEQFYFVCLAVLFLLRKLFNYSSSPFIRLKSLFNLKKESEQTPISTVGAPPQSRASKAALNHADGAFLDEPTVTTSGTVFRRAISQPSVSTIAPSVFSDHSSDHTMRSRSSSWGSFWSEPKARHGTSGDSNMRRESNTTWASVSVASTSPMRPRANPFIPAARVPPTSPHTPPQQQPAHMSQSFPPRPCMLHAQIPFANLQTQTHLHPAPMSTNIPPHAGSLQPNVRLDLSQPFQPWSLEEVWFPVENGPGFIPPTHVFVTNVGVRPWLHALSYLMLGYRVWTTNWREVTINELLFAASPQGDMVPKSFATARQGSVWLGHCQFGRFNYVQKDTLRSSTLPAVLYFKSFSDYCVIVPRFNTTTENTETLRVQQTNSDRRTRLGNHRPGVYRRGGVWREAYRYDVWRKGRNWVEDDVCELLNRGYRVQDREDGNGIEIVQKNLKRTTSSGEEEVAGGSMLRKVHSMPNLARR